MQIVSVPIIMIISYSIISVIKSTCKNEKLNNFLPLIAGGIGIIFGIIAFYTIPSIIPSSTVLGAILIGFISGLSATGSNQLIKQIKEFTAINKEKIDISSQEDSKNESNESPTNKSENHTDIQETENTDSENNLNKPE